MFGTARRYLILAASALLLASAAHAARSLATEVTERGWKPALMLTGEGDRTRAIPALRAGADLWSVTLHHTELDPSTADFMKRALASLKDFDLEGMYKLLPQKNGAFRELAVRGARQRDRYVIGRATDAQFEVGPTGNREQAGDSSLVLRSRPVADADGDDNYLIQARGGVVIGKLAWPTVTSANRDWLRLLTAQDHEQNHEQNHEKCAERPMVGLRQAVLAANPALDAEDVEVIATLWEAFPRMSYLVRSLGHIDSLHVEDATHAATPSTSPKHLSIVLRMDPQRMTERYPELAHYASTRGQLLRVDLDWLDTRGRKLASLHVESERLLVRVQLYTKDGLIFPFKNGHVFADEPLDLSHQVLAYTTNLQASVRMLGVRTHLHDARMDFRYEPTARGMELRGRMTRVPDVELVVWNAA